MFVTWNLKGAMPAEAIEHLEQERDWLQKRPLQIGETPKQRRSRNAKRLFAVADQFLDAAANGPLHLKEPTAAKIVEDAILFGAELRYELFAWCVMANHVHVLLTPIWKYEKITQGIKGFTAHEINSLHCRT